MPQIKDSYVASGSVRIVYHHFPFLGEESFQAALASECAGEQGAFWPFHELLYANQQGINQGGYAREVLDGYARDLGLDIDQFSACMDDARYRPEIEGDLALGVASGVESTPTTFILRGDAGAKIEGVQPFSEVASLIDQLLAKDAGE